MDVEQFESYQNSLRLLLNRAIVQSIERNGAQRKIWQDYSQAHKKVRKGLEILPRELTTNCMVPIGRKALMRGKLMHTNEILVCLGEGYFGKYSAKQAIDLCDRRIKQAEEMLVNLGKERNLLEMRHALPEDLGIFGNEDHKEIIEDYDEEEEKQWRLVHRQREREYRQRLATLRKQEKMHVETEEDLWRRLDELELQEELEDEINRLQEGNSNYYMDEGSNRDDNYSDSDGSFSQDETPDDTIENGNAQLKCNTMTAERRADETVVVPIPSSDHRNSASSSANCSQSPAHAVMNIENARYVTEDMSIENSCNIGDTKLSTKNREKRRVSFLEEQSTTINDPPSSALKSNVNGEDTECQTLLSRDLADDKKHEEAGDEDDVIRIEFRHSDRQSALANYSSTDNTIESPLDIYRMFCKTKSILKTTSSHRTVDSNISWHDDVASQQEDDVPYESPYTILVKDVEERDTNLPEIKQTTNVKRPPSKFKMARSGRI